MKKAIKILSYILLLNSFANLISSQNVKTFAAKNIKTVTKKVIETDDEEVDDEETDDEEVDDEEVDDEEVDDEEADDKKDDDEEVDDEEADDEEVDDEEADDEEVNDEEADDKKDDDEEVNDEEADDKEADGEEEADNYGLNEIIQGTEELTNKFNLIKDKKISNKKKLAELKETLTNLVVQSDEVDQTNLDKEQLSNLNAIKKMLINLEKKLDKKSKLSNINSLNSDMNELREMLDKINSKSNKLEIENMKKFLTSSMNEIKEMLNKSNNKKNKQKENKPDYIDDINNTLLEMKDKINQLKSSSDNSNNKEESRNLYELVKFMDEIKKNVTTDKSNDIYKFKEMFTEFFNKFNEKIDTINDNSKGKAEGDEFKSITKNDTHQIMTNPIKFIQDKLSKAELKTFKNMMADFWNNIDSQLNNFEYIRQRVDDLRVFLEDTEKFNENEIDSIINAIMFKLNAELFKKQKMNKSYPAILDDNQQLVSQKLNPKTGPIVSDSIKSNLLSLLDKFERKWYQKQCPTLKTPPSSIGIRVGSKGYLTTDEIKHDLITLRKSLLSSSFGIDANMANELQAMLANMLDQLDSNETNVTNITIPDGPSADEARRMFESFKQQIRQQKQLPDGLSVDDMQRMFESVKQQIPDASIRFQQNDPRTEEIRNLKKQIDDLEKEQFNVNGKNKYYEYMDQRAELWAKQRLLRDRFYEKSELEYATKKLESLKLQKDELQKQLNAETQDDKKTELNKQLAELTEQIEKLNRQIENTLKVEELDKQVEDVNSKLDDYFKRADDIHEKRGQLLNLECN